VRRLQWEDRGRDSVYYAACNGSRSNHPQKWAIIDKEWLQLSQRHILANQNIYNARLEKMYEGCAETTLWQQCKSAVEDHPKTAIAISVVAVSILTAAFMYRPQRR